MIKYRIIPLTTVADTVNLPYIKEFKEGTQVRINEWLIVFRDCGAITASYPSDKYAIEKIEEDQ